MAPVRTRSVRRGATGAIIALGCALAGIVPAGAVDWQVLYLLTETLSVSDNLQQREEPEGLAFSSDTGARLDVAALTPTAEWRATGNLGHVLYLGKGIPEEDDRPTMSARSSLLKRTPRTDFNLNARFSMAPATTSVFTGPVLIDPALPIPDPTDPDVTDPGLTDLELLDFDRISYGASGGLAHRLSRIDRLSLTAGINRLDFTGNPPNVTPNTSVMLSGNWTRQLTRRLDGRASASVDYSLAEDDSEQRLLYQLALGGNFRATPRLTADANVGISITDERQSDAVVAAGVPDISLGIVGDLRLSYRPWSDTTMTLAVSQQTAPDNLGNLRTVQRASAAVNYQVNALSSINLTGAFEMDEVGDNRRILTVSPTYTYALAPSWNLSLSYRLITSEFATSNTAFLTLSHRGTLLP